MHGVLAALTPTDERLAGQSTPVERFGLLFTVLRTLKSNHTASVGQVGTATPKSPDPSDH
jgi:hypothetical protein